jgi:Fe-S-cluster containining protein
MALDEDKTNEDLRATVHVAFNVAGSHVVADIEVPAGPTTLREILPVVHDITDAIVSIAEQSSEAGGTKISCRKGCGACCRQLVPISVDEAAAIRDMVDEMPEERRTAVLNRFSDAHQRLQAAELLEKLRNPEQFTETELRPLGIEYFRLGIPCPFLEDESCSVHADRPLTCREYLVTSDPADCAKPTAETIKMVAMPVKLSNIITRIGVLPGSRYTRWQPLILAVDPPSEAQSGEVSMPGPDLLKLVFERMADKPILKDEPHPGAENITPQTGR